MWTDISADTVLGNFIICKEFHIAFLDELLFSVITKRFSQNYTTTAFHNAI